MPNKTKPSSSSNSTSLKVGLIFECGPQGADKKVCEILLKKLNPEIKPKSITLNNKPNLVQQCGISAKILLDSEGCDRVLILWDLYPAWRTDGERPCRKEDCDAIFQALDNAGVDRSKVHLVCITEELEAWLIADGGAISTTLSRPTHKITVSDYRKPEQVKNPKKILSQIYQQKIRQKYNDVTDAEKIAKNIFDFKKIRRSESFCRFVLKATDVNI
jgi:Domain of unknown function (DUF4276)